MNDLAAVSAVRCPLVRCQRQVAASHVLVVGLFGGLGCLYTLSDRDSIYLPGHHQSTWVEFAHQTHQCGLVGLKIIQGRQEKGDQRVRLGLTCADKEGDDRCHRRAQVTGKHPCLNRSFVTTQNIVRVIDPSRDLLPSSSLSPQVP